MYICRVLIKHSKAIYHKEKNIMTTYTTYQPKQTQGGKPSVTGMSYLKGSEEII